MFEVIDWVASWNSSNSFTPWCCGYHYFTTSFSKASNQVLRPFKPYSWRVGDARWWGSPTMVPAGNKAKRLLSVNHTTKTIHHHHHSVSLTLWSTIHLLSQMTYFILKTYMTWFLIYLFLSCSFISNSVKQVMWVQGDGKQ